MKTEQDSHKNESSCGERGFSLVELLIVMALLGIMFAIAITAIRSQLPKMHMNGTARDIAGRLMMERLKAVQNNGAYGLSFTPGIGGSYVPVTNSLGSSSSCGSGTWVNDGSVNHATPDVTVAVSGASCTNRTEFYQNGTMCGCDTITVTSSDNQVMSITVDQTTGNVQVQ